MRILTASEIAAWKSCPKKWWFRYHEELVPNKTPQPLSYGRLVHRMLEAYYKGEQFSAEGDIDQYTMAEVEALTDYYCEHDPVAQSGHTVTGVEEEFCVSLRSPSGRRYNRIMLAGKLDLRTEDQYGSPWLWDHKTSSTDLKRDWLEINDQMAFYLWANWQLGYNPAGIIYNLIRKPQIKPALATRAELRKYKKDGKLYANMRDTDETIAEWKERVKNDITTRPKFYFQKEDIVKSPTDLRRIENDLWALAHIVGKRSILRNPNHCQFFGCAYRELCKNDTKLGRATGYRHERPHIELSKEMME